jgi:DNA-binding MarR family transcriptional regulator
LTGVIKTLQTRKLIRRLPHKDDRRRVSIQLTKSGERLIEALFPKFNEHERVAVGSLSPTEQRELARLLRKVTHGITESTTD